MMLPVNIHELLGMGIRAARQRRGWRQQDASKEFRSAGLPTWTPLAVGQVESGTRKPSVGDLLLACTALGVSFADLVPDVEDRVDLGSGATMKASAIRAILSGKNPGDIEVGDEIVTPGDKWLAEAVTRSLAERERVEPLLRPIWERSRRRIMREDTRRVFVPPTETEQRAAERLGVEPVQLKAAARVRWNRDFEDERDARVGDASDVAPQTLQARRGHATRAMLAELAEFLGGAGISEEHPGVPPMSDPFKTGHRPDGSTYYWFRVDVGRDPVSGRDSLYRSFDRLKDAKAEYARVVTDVAERRYVARSGTTVRAYLESWLPAHTRHGGGRSCQDAAPAATDSGPDGGPTPAGTHAR